MKGASWTILPPTLPKWIELPPPFLSEMASQPVLRKIQGGRNDVAPASLRLESVALMDLPPKDPNDDDEDEEDDEDEDNQEEPDVREPDE
jgi:hypothetical protein